MCRAVHSSASIVHSAACHARHFPSSAPWWQRHAFPTDALRIALGAWPRLLPTGVDLVPGPMPRRLRRTAANRGAKSGWWWTVRGLEGHPLG